MVVSMLAVDAKRKETIKHDKYSYYFTPNEVSQLWVKIFLVLTTSRICATAFRKIRVFSFIGLNLTIFIVNNVSILTFFENRGELIFVLCEKKPDIMSAEEKKVAQ